MKSIKNIGIFILLLISILSVNAVDILQLETSTTNYGVIGYSSSLQSQVGQSFSLSVNASILGVECYYSELGTVTDNVNLEIQTDSGSLPSGVIVNSGASGSFNGNIGSSNVEINTTLTNEANVTANTEYHIVLSRSGAYSTTNNVRIRGLLSSSYYNSTTSGELFSSGSWGESGSNTIYACKIYYDVINETTTPVNVTPPVAGETYNLQLGATQTNYNVIGYSVAVGEDSAQRLLFPYDICLEAVNFQYYELGTGQDVYIRIESDSGSTTPSGTLIEAGAATTLLASELLGASYNYINKSFSSCVNIPASTPFWVRLEHSAFSPSNNVRIGLEYNSPNYNASSMSKGLINSVWATGTNSQFVGNVYYNTGIDSSTIQITNISVNDETFINNTIFDINDLYFNVTYQYNNTEYGNGTNSTQFSLLDLDNGVFTQYIEVCTNSSNTTCDARNITFTINVTTAIVFNSIKFNNDELSLIEENYFNTNNLFINIILQNISTNEDINTKFSLYQSDAPWQLIDSRFFMFNALTGGTNISSVLTDNTNYRIFFFAENNETETTTGYYYFTLDSISPVISHNIPTEINNYNLAGISITVTDTNAGTCIINIEDTNFTCSSFTGYNFTTNGYKNWTITATDLAGNQRVATGQLLVNPLAVYSFYDIVNLEYVQNYTFGGYSSVGSYVEIPIYDLGLGSHSLEFYKLGYNSSSYNVEFTDTSNINKSFNVTPVRIEIRVYNQVTNELINTTVNLDLIGTTNINQSTLTGIFNITSYVAPGEYQVFISSSDYVSNQLSFTYTSVDLIKENIYLIPSNYSLAGYVNIITYNKDNTYASEIPVIAYEWDSSTSSYKQTYKTQSDTNGKAVIFVILQDKIYKFCAEYTTGTVCFPGGTQGQIIPVSQNGDTFPILPVLNFPQVTTSFKDLDFGIQTNLTNYSSSFFNYTLDYIWSNRNGLSVTICTKLVKDFNYSTQTIVDSCLTQPSGEYIHSFLLNNSFSYILTVYQKLGTEKVELYSERVNGEDSFWGALDYFNIKNLFIIVLICIMLGVIPLLKNSFLIVGDVLLVVFILWKYIIPQSLSITSVGVIIVMALLTLWGLSKK